MHYKYIYAKRNKNSTYILTRSHARAHTYHAKKQMHARGFRKEKKKVNVKRPEELLYFAGSIAKRVSRNTAGLTLSSIFCLAEAAILLVTVNQK